MKRQHFIYFIGILALGLLFGGKALSQTNTTILVSAAASLKEALEEIKSGFEKNNTAIRVNYNFAASGALKEQIEQGAPVDLFISAAAKQIDALSQKGLIDKTTQRNLLTNRLVLVVPSSSNLNITGFGSLTNRNVKRISVGEPRTVPVGQYTEELLSKLGIIAQVKSKLVYANSVRSVLTAVEMGNADAGFVYITDARISNKVKVITIADKSLHAPIVYPMAILKDSKNPQAAKKYAQYLTSNTAKRVFEKYGFGIAH